MASRARVLGKIAAGVAGALLILSPTACTGSEPAADGPFGDQARAAHLTRAQDRALRGEVAKYLQSNGGRQISLNEIDVNGLEKIRVAIPGEAYPRDLVNSPTAVPSAMPYLVADAPSGSPCAGRTGSGYLCMFSGTGYTGTETDVRQCSTSPLADHVRTGIPFDFTSDISDLKDPGADWTNIPC